MTGLSDKMTQFAHSIRFRLVLWFAAFLALILAVFSAFIFSWQYPTCMSTSWPAWSGQSRSGKLRNAEDATIAGSASRLSQAGDEYLDPAQLRRAGPKTGLHFSTAGEYLANEGQPGQPPNAPKENAQVYFSGPAGNRTQGRRNMSFLDSGVVV